jgi:hypothetical protein
VIRPFQLGKVNVLTWSVLNGRIRRFAERQGVTGIGNHPALDVYNNASGIEQDGNRIIWTWKLDLLFFLVLISPLCSCSALQELRDMLNKQLWVLVLRTIIAAGVRNELRVRQVLLEDERVQRIDDHVVAAVHHERGLSDLVQVSIGIFRPSAPFL